MLEYYIPFHVTKEKICKILAQLHSRKLKTVSGNWMMKRGPRHISHTVEHAEAGEERFFEVHA